MSERADETAVVFEHGLWMTGLESFAPRCWDARRELGIIADTESLSPGLLVTQFAADEPNDGMVSVAEMQLPGATAHLSQHVSHAGILFSFEVTRQVCAFLEVGRFDGEAA
jgi:hypothetical protein